MRTWRAAFDFGTTADSWQQRLQKLSKSRLRGRFFAATRRRLRDVAERFGLRQVPHLGGCPANSLTGAGHKLAIAKLTPPSVGLAILAVAAFAGAALSVPAGHPPGFASRWIAGVARLDPQAGTLAIAASQPNLVVRVSLGRAHVGNAGLAVDCGDLASR